MKRQALFIIGGDPRISARPAEAIRIAAGIGTWKKISVRIYLEGAAVLALSEFPDDLVDETIEPYENPNRTLLRPMKPLLKP